MPGDGIFLIHDDGIMVEMQSELFNSEAELQSLLQISRREGLVDRLVRDPHGLII